MSASATDDERDRETELCRRGIAFLQGAHDLPELSAAQLDRIEQRLHRARPHARRPVLTLSLAVVAFLLLAGAALAVTGRGLSRLPVVGAWVDALLAPRSATGSARAPRRAPAPVAPVAPAPVAPVAPAPGRAPPATVVASTTAGSMEAPMRPRARARLVPETASVPALAPPSSPSPWTSPALAPPPAPPPSSLAPPASSLAPPPSSLAPPPARVAAPPPAPPAAPPPAASSSTPAPAPASPIVAESRSFASALERWHRDHDARAALEALDAHERRFPNGEIRLEAQLLRAEIFLARGREREGLALLDPLALGSLPRARELRTVRGTLRIRFGRCAEGKADLGAVLAQGASDRFAQRARQALADCP